MSVFYYNVSPTGDVATSATANTQVDHLRMLTVANQRAVKIVGLYMTGKGAAQTSITGIEVTLERFATPSTVGTAITPAATETGYPAAALTAFTGPTIGATPTLQLSVGCMSSGVGGWTALNPAHARTLQPNGGANGNLDLLSETQGTVALNFHYDLEFSEG